MKATVFISGGWQAVRIPKEFRIDAKRVEIERKGATLVLRPLPDENSYPNGYLESFAAGQLDDSFARHSAQIRQDLAKIGQAVNEAMWTLEKENPDLADVLAEELSHPRKRPRLRTIERKLDNLIRLNSSRYDFLGRFQKMIEAYNSGALSIEQWFAELVTFTQDLNDEEQRHLREQISEEELAVFDILTRPGPDLTAKETEAIKKVCKDLWAEKHQPSITQHRRGKSGARRSQHRLGRNADSHL